MHKLIIVAALCTLPTAIAAQDARTDAAIVVPAHTEMALRLDEEIASDRARVGQTVAVSVARDVIVDGAVLIPRGAPGVGAVTFRTGKGAFGKSGKLDIELRSVAACLSLVAITLQAMAGPARRSARSSSVVSWRGPSSRGITSCSRKGASSLPSPARRPG